MNQTPDELPNSNGSDFESTPDAFALLAQFRPFFEEGALKEPAFAHDLKAWQALGTERRHATLTEDALEAMPIRDNGEPLLPLSQFLHQAGSHIQLSVGASYGAQSLDTQKLRDTAAHKLLLAEKILQALDPRLSLRVTDSFRPIELQRQYFETIKADLTAKGLHGDELYHAVTAVIADPDRTPPHSTGGVVDLTLYEIATGKDLDLGSVLDDVADPLAQVFHPKTPAAAREARLLLYTAMRGAGFTCTPNEWWHWAYGDREWAAFQDQAHAIYGSFKA